MLVLRWSLLKRDILFIKLCHWITFHKQKGYSSHWIPQKSCVCGEEQLKLIYYVNEQVEVPYHSERLFTCLFVHFKKPINYKYEHFYLLEVTESSLN